MKLPITLTLATSLDRHRGITEAVADRFEQRSPKEREIVFSRKLAQKLKLLVSPRLGRRTLEIVARTPKLRQREDFRSCSLGSFGGGRDELAIATSLAFPEILLEKRESYRHRSCRPPHLLLAHKFGRKYHRSDDVTTATWTGNRGRDDRPLGVSESSQNRNNYRVFNGFCG